MRISYWSSDVCSSDLSLWTLRWRRRLTPATDAPPAARLPKVSVHVPCYNEPPEMVIDTLKALQRLDYPDFEVLVIDNNTKDPAIWQPGKIGRASCRERVCQYV